MTTKRDHEREAYERGIAEGRRRERADMAAFLRKRTLDWNSGWAIDSLLEEAEGGAHEGAALK